MKQRPLLSSRVSGMKIFYSTMSLGELCFTLEQKWRAGETANLDDLLAVLGREYARVQSSLETELARLPVGSDP